MERDETPEEERAFFDYMDAREAALVAAAGTFVVDNVPNQRLRIIAAFTTNEMIRLAAEIVLHQRGEDYDVLLGVTEVAPGAD